MPRLLKNIEARIISLFGGETSSDFTAPVKLLQQFVGEVDTDGYIKLTAFEAFTQDFKNVGEAEFCPSTPTIFGLGRCPTYTEINKSY
jgi:hypothetical protein